MRRLLAALLALLLIVPSVGAESLFDALPSPQRETAPSYGAMKGVEPDVSNVTEDGGAEEVYTDVTSDDYHAFGALLARLGYTVGEQSATDDETNFVVVKEEISFRVVYRAVDERLTVTYPANVTAESPAQGASAPDIPQTIEVGAVYHYGRVIATSAKLRRDPSTTMAERVTLAENTVVWVTTAEIDSAGTVWVAATVGDQSGYIKSQQVALMGVNEEARYRATLDNPMQPPTPTPKPTATLRPTATPKRVFVRYVHILEEVNVRKGPFTKYDYMQKAYPDEYYLYMETNPKTGWYKIMLNDGREGYVSFNYTELVWR